MKALAEFSFFWLSHSRRLQKPYLTAAAAIGSCKEDIDVFIKRLRSSFKVSSLYIVNMYPLEWFCPRIEQKKEYAYENPRYDCFSCRICWRAALHSIRRRSICQLMNEDRSIYKNFWVRFFCLVGWLVEFVDLFSEFETDNRKISAQSLVLMIGVAASIGRWTVRFRRRM